MITGASFFEANSPESGKLDGALTESNSAGEPEAVMDPSTLEPGKPGLRWTLLESAEEVLECPLKVSQSFLWSAFRDLIHPRILGPLEFNQLAMQFDGISEPCVAL